MKKSLNSLYAIIVGVLALISVSADATFGQSFDQRIKERQMAEKLRQITDRSGAGLAPVTLPDGSMMVDLQGKFQYAMLAQLNEYGHPVASCVASLAEANAFFGRDLETGENLRRTNRRFDTAMATPAEMHGMSDREFEFFKGLIERYEEQLLLNPSSATITIVNNNGPGEGFNDPSPRTEEGGNTGTTLGQQRLNVFNAAAAIWGGFLDSNVPIQVRSNFDPLTCTQTSAVLGSASTLTLHGNHLNAGFLNTWHHQALANKQAGADLSPNPDMQARFNSNLDGRPDCLQGGRFYLGLDNAQPFMTTNLLIVVLHEMAHGLGFSDFVDETTGGLFNGFPDVYTTHLRDRTTSKMWNNMTNAERLISQVNNNNVLWDGANVKFGSAGITTGRDADGRVEVYTPNPYQGGSSVAHWNTRVFPNLLMEPFITAGLPLNLDLTRQFMRDIGWYRDSDGNGTPDTITNVTPSGNTIVIGTPTTITWANGGGFNGNVVIELSMDGGTTFPTVLTPNWVNSGTFTFTVPNTPTTQAKIRIRETGFASPAGESSQVFSIATTLPPADNAFIDFDGDGKTDVSVFRPLGGTGGGEWWYLKSSDGVASGFAFGSQTDIPVPADFTGDGKTDIAFWRESTGDWFVMRSEDFTYYAFPYGTAGDIPMPGDYDGDGEADATVFRPSTNTWYSRRSSDGGTTVIPFGQAGDRPISADFDGDGKADIAVYRPSGSTGGGEWYYIRSSDGQVRGYAFGSSTDKAVPADYTGDGKADIAFWRPSTGEWYVLRSEDNTFYAFPFGTSTDIPVVGDYDGDGKADAAVFRPSNNTWYMQRSTAGFEAIAFGSAGDKPLPNVFVR